ncbi:DMT family transporter [Evansella tamaricis]|uniref:DMT family transporter n=1 Tax=Evansella tamaricis TaxID=2069301 RepID=A0ABS6JET8_9BACI|nr:DMT family transporter [Evansella tamaricis]MBU9712187.1 DMT family transporter [Evansella tamaricis]
MGYLLALLSALCFSITNIILKKGMSHSKHNGVWFITFVNVIILGVILLLSLYVFNFPLLLDSKGLFIFLVSGVLINVMGRGLLYKGIRQIGSSKAVAIKNSAPVITFLFAVFVIDEQITKWPFIGILLLFFGLLLLGIQFFKEGVHQPVHRGGYYIALLSAIGYGLGQGLSKEGIAYLPNPYVGVFVGSLGAFLLLTIIEGCRGKLVEHFKSSSGNPYYLWAGVLTSLALLLFYLSVSYIPVSYAVAILAVDPVLTVILVSLFMKKEELISKLIILVSILVFAGAVIISLTGS